jgi:transposase InsO family protein
VLAIVDAFTRECLSLEVDTGLSSQRVTRVLERIVERRGAPNSIRSDNGPELTSRHFAISSPGAKNARSNSSTYNRASPLRTLISKASTDGYEMNA